MTTSVSDKDLTTLETALIRHQIRMQWLLVDKLDENELKRSPTKVLACPLCDFQAALEDFQLFESNCIFEGGRLSRRQCPQCDLIFGPQKMLSLNQFELAREYEWHYRVFSEGDSTNLELSAFAALSPMRGGLYLNYGCGAWSKSLQILRSQGWNVVGFEPHSAANRGGDGMITASQLQELRFDGIFSNNVLEHLRHPVEELAALGRLLKSDGKMCHATPCFSYLYEYTRFHLFFYLGRSREVLARRAGLKLHRFINEGEFMAAIFRN